MCSTRCWLISFITLAWTGFALKYPGPVVGASIDVAGREPARHRAPHRGAVSSWLSALTHVISLIVNRRLRRHWMELFPKPRMRAKHWPISLTTWACDRAAPGRSSHSYIEKAEYWAVVWGAIVMIATGLMLWGNNLMLALFPKVWLDVATSVHFYEALLATLAIVVWHFYTVIFDPDVYPMDTAWLTGVSVKKTGATSRGTRAGRADPKRCRRGDHIEMNETPIAQAARPNFLPWCTSRNNWISLVGVVVVTTATVFWLFLLPTTMRGEVHNPYNGILAFLLLPASVLPGPDSDSAGHLLAAKPAERSSGLYPASFPPINMRNLEFRRLVTFVGVTTFANIVIASQLAYGAVSYMETRSFCGQTCHTVMQPEFTAYQSSPHSRVECVQCHIGPGESWFVRSKMSGIRQVFAVMFHTYETPIPTPVEKPASRARNLRKPATGRRNTAKTGCASSTNTATMSIIPLTKTVLLMKIGGGNKGIGIHGTHLGAGIAHPLRAFRRAAPDHPVDRIQRAGRQDRVSGGRRRRGRQGPDHPRDGLHGLPQPPLACLQTAGARDR